MLSNLKPNKVASELSDHDLENVAGGTVGQRLRNIGKSIVNFFCVDDRRLTFDEGTNNITAEVDSSLGGYQEV